MTEVSIPWGNGLGDGHPYTQDEWRDVMSAAIARQQNSVGVLRGVANQYLASGATSPCVVQTGKAIVNGTIHISDANVNVAIPTPAGATRIDVIVLRKSWASGQVRITRVAGAEGGGVPAITQTDGVTWDIPLWQASITTGGAITYTDVRTFAIIGAESWNPTRCGCRLSLSPSDPVGVLDISGATSLYLLPWKPAPYLPVFVNGGLKNLLVQDAGIPLYLGDLAAATLYDIFAYGDQYGGITLEATKWSNSSAGLSARSVYVTMYKGVPVKSGDISRTYLGTIRTVGAGQVDDTQARRYLWNYFNRVRKVVLARYSAKQFWFWSTDAWRTMDSNTTEGVGRVAFVVGLSGQDMVDMHLEGSVRQSSDNDASHGTVGLGLNSTTLELASVRTEQYYLSQDSTGLVRAPVYADYKGYMPAGYNYVQRLEYGIDTGHTEFWGAWQFTPPSGTLPLGGLLGTVSV